MRLAEALDQSPTSTLRRVASAHGLAHDDTTTRDELIAGLSERFADRAYITELLNALTHEERDVLASAHASYGELRAQIVDGDHPGMAEDLADGGWLFRVFAAAGPLRGEVFVVPDEVLELVRAPDEPRLRTDAAAPAEQRWTDPAFSLFALASALTRHGGHLEREVRHWSQEPGGWEWDARWTFLQQVALAAGLLSHAADREVPVATTLTRLLDDRRALSQRLWRSYLRDRGWCELQQVHPQLREEVDAIALRSSVIEAVGQLPPGEWLRLESFSDWLRHSRPRFLREQLTPRGLATVQNVDWAELELPTLRYFMLGPLYWLGRVATSRDGGLVSRRESVARSAAAEACEWEGAAELVAPATTQLGTLLQAERYLVLNARDRVSRYHLVQSHVAVALGSGGSITECRRLLEQLTQSSLPATVDERLTSWDERFGTLVIRPAVLLEARSAEDLNAAITDESVRHFVRARLGPTVAEVAAADALELAGALRSSDHLPRIDAALRLKAFGGLVDEQVLEFLLVNLLALRTAWPERLQELEGSTALVERLEDLFPPERLAELHKLADRVAGRLSGTPRPPRRRRKTVTRKM